VKTYVIYRYQAPRSYEAEDMKTETWCRSPVGALSTTHREALEPAPSPIRQLGE
jgi:hypothetical protein